MTKREREQISELVRSKVLRCRANESEYDAAAKAAAEAHLSLSEWLRWAIREQAKPKDPTS